VEPRHQAGPIRVGQDVQQTAIHDRIERLAEAREVPRVPDHETGRDPPRLRFGPGLIDRGGRGVQPQHRQAAAAEEQRELAGPAADVQDRARDAARGGQSHEHRLGPADIPGRHGAVRRIEAVDLDRLVGRGERSVGAGVAQVEGGRVGRVGRRLFRRHGKPSSLVSGPRRRARPAGARRTVGRRCLLVYPRGGRVDISRSGYLRAPPGISMRSGDG
jgi:hypothetical protein